MPLKNLHPYSTAEPLLSSYPQWVGREEALRIASYQLYEALYWNIQNTLEVAQRGSDDKPIYIPTPMQIVETHQRFLANDLAIMTAGETNDQIAAGNILWNAFTSRERFYSKFTSNKRFGIIRGDWLFHIQADESRPEGSRISIFPLDPAAFFPIYNEENLDEVIGCFIVEQVEEEGYIRRIKYEKDPPRGGPARILVSDEIFPIDKWGGPGVEEGKPQRFKWHESYRQAPLPIEITSLPVYHIPHFSEPGFIFGSSELRGFERLFAAINQGISDEELTLALEGLGVYATDAGRPVDEEGNPVDWDIGPARVVELPDDSFFQRVSGVSSVQPFQDHLNYLHDAIDAAKGMSDASKGSASVELAESGRALRLKMEPLLSRVREKEQIVTDVTGNLLHDLRDWFAAYEGEDWIYNIEWWPVYGEKIPPNNSERFKEIMDMVKQAVIDSQTAREMLTELGYKFPSDIDNRVAKEDQRKADVIGWRIDNELEGGE